MRKTLLNTLVTAALAMSGTAHAGLTFDLNGAAAGGVINATSFDWDPTSALYMGGNAAIAGWLRDFDGSDGSTAGVVNGVHAFDVLTHARLTGYTDANTGLSVALSRSDEVTLVARYTQIVAGVTHIPGMVSSAFFQSTGSGFLDMYYGSTKNSDNLTGSGFDDGTLIMHAQGVQSGVLGIFDVNLSSALSNLDRFPAGDDYPGQLTAAGAGTHGNLQIGTATMALDGNFFNTDIAGFAINFANTSLSLPFLSVNPSDCFNPVAAGNAVGTNDGVSQCANKHVVGPFSAQGPDGGYRPTTGVVNALLDPTLGGPDRVIQVDFSTAVSGVPEPETYVMMVAGLGLVILAARRRRCNRTEPHQEK